MLVYVVVLTAMVCSALVARLPTPLAALGALCFAASDLMIGVARFLVPFDTFQLGIWWTYAAAQVLIVAGIVSGRAQA
ncbi:YhhN-like protein [compost metagenome]